MSPRTCFGFPEPPIRPRGGREQSLERPSLTTTHKRSERSPEPASSSIGHENSGPTSVPQRNNSGRGVNLLRSAYCAGSPSDDRLSLPICSSAPPACHVAARPWRPWHDRSNEGDITNDVRRG